MKMQIPIAKIFQEVIANNDKADPFNEEFDKKKFLSILNALIEEYGQTFEILNKEQYSIKVDIIFTLNTFYESLMLEIEKLIDTINIDESFWIDLIFAITNFDYYNTMSAREEVMVDKEHGGPQNLEEMYEINLKNIFGDEVDSQEAIDMTVDISKELISIIKSFEPRQQKDLPVLDQKEIYNMARRLMLVTNLLLNLRAAFHTFKFELGDIIIEKDIIKIKYYPEYYYLLKQVGKQRKTNHLHEFLSLTMQSKRESKKFSHQLSFDNILQLKDENIREVNKIEALSEASLLSYYFYLFTKGSISQDIKIHDIFSFVASLKIIINSIDGESILNECELKENFSCVPIKILKSELRRKLLDSLKSSAKTIDKLLRIISEPITHYSNFWLSPLAEHGEYYYFLITPIVQGHFEYLVDNILSKIVSLNKLEEKFKDFIASELPSQIGKKYAFKRVNATKFEQSLSKNKTLLVFETLENIIVLNVCLFNFPIESKEYSGAFTLLSEAAIKLEESLEIIEASNSKLKNGAEKKIVGAIITNHTSHSGIIINRIPILDYTLLKNYLSSGEYRRGMIIMGNNQLRTEELASYKYYESEEEFNKNLKNFLYWPNPITEAMEFFKIIESPLLLPKARPQVYASAIENQETKSILLRKFNKLKYYLNQLFYFKSSLDQESYIETVSGLERQIMFILPQVFSMAALENTDRSLRDELLGLFKKVGNIGLGYLLLSLQNSLEKIVSKGIKNKPEKGSQKSTSEINYDEAERNLSQIFKENMKEGDAFRLSEANFKHNLSDQEHANLVQYLINLLSTFEPRPYTEEELNEYLFVITIYIGLVTDKVEHKHTTQTIILNFLDILNSNFQYQKARNFCEEVLSYSFSKESHPLIGWLCLYKCFLKQGNIYDASFYGVLLYMSIDVLPEIDESFFVDILYTSMLFFRNFGHSEMGSKIFNILKDFKLSDYDELKITLSHYNGILQRDKDEIVTLLPEVKDYLSNKIPTITKYNDQGVIPWVAFIYNLKNINSITPIENFVFFEEKLEILKSFVKKETLDNLEQQYFPIDKMTSILFKESLIKVFETSSFEDLSHDFDKLKLIANNVAKLSLVPINLDDLLLTGLVFNDQSLTFNPKEVTGVIPFIQKADEGLIDKIKNYSHYLLNELPIKPGQLVCWMFNINSEVYLLKITEDKTSTLDHLISWDLDMMETWLSSISRFYFDDNGDFPINEQESSYLSILNQLSFSQLNFNEQYNEILLVTSIGLSQFPHNLIKINIDSGGNMYDAHEYAIKNYIDNFKADLVSFHKPIVNIISFEWFIEFGQQIKLSKENLKIESWIPIVDGDIAITIGYNKIRPIIEDRYGGKIYTELVPPNKLSSAVNVFLAHGGKGTEGFRTVYTKNLEGHAINRERGIESVFGNGVIAVVFVCNSAYITKEIYAQRLASFVHHILSLGYKTVIAPAWSLNPDIASIWLDSFISSLGSGETVSFSAQRANHTVAKEGYNEYHGFYTPTGWAAMHVYGNPNIQFE